MDNSIVVITSTRIALEWVKEAETVIFMGIPNPAPSFRFPGIEIIASSAMDF
jgi:hypothetical protein